MAFVLAHLSDPHLAPLPVPNLLHLRFKQFAGYVNWLRSRQFIHRRAVLDKIAADLAAQKPDHIVVGGDIANIALPFEFVRGSGWLEGLGSAEKVSIVPGNHDIYVPGALDFARNHWGAYLHGDAGESFPYVRRRRPVALIGLNSGAPTELFFANGTLGQAQLEKLAAILDATRDAFRLIVIHHPPVSQSSWRKRLTDAETLMRMIAEHGAELLVHGHDHLPMLNWLDGPNGGRVPAVGVPSASSAPGKGKADAGYNLFRIDGTPGAWTCEMVVRGIDAGGSVSERKRVRLTG
jgi:3',5'-cyclic AMP phosphodiesterase CpdA